MSGRKNDGSAITMRAKKKKCGSYNATIRLDPVPTFCHECPFYYMPEPKYEGSADEYWTCFLGGIKNNRGTALNRPSSCPLPSGATSMLETLKMNNISLSDKGEADNEDDENE